MKRKRRYKSVITKRIWKSVRKLGMVLCFFALMLGAVQVRGTNSFFSDTAAVSGSTMTAGYWIPELAMTVDPASPDGQNGWYKTKPCIILTSSISDVEIYYQFKHNSTTVTNDYSYPGSCILVPDGEWDFSAYAVNNANSSWVSNTVSESFKVDIDDPVVKITNPNDKDTVSGTVEIKGTFTDNVPKNYQMKIKDHLGASVYDSGIVPVSASFADHKIYDWDTTKVADGNYTIEFAGTDGPGNSASDSIKVTVGNSSSVVLNEILPDPAGNDNDDKDHSEFVELYNNDKTSHDLNGWRIYIGDSDFIEINNTTTDGAGTVINSKNRLVVWFYKKWHNSELKNSSDTVSLYDGLKSSAKKYDSYTYSYSGSKIGSSFVRDPDGYGDWKDPVPTPGKKNTMEEDFSKYLDHYRKICFNEKNEPICEEEFMKSIGLIDNKQTLDAQALGTATANIGTGTTAVSSINSTISSETAPVAADPAITTPETTTPADGTTVMTEPDKSTDPGTNALDNKDSVKDSPSDKPAETATVPDETKKDNPPKDNTDAVKADTSKEDVKPSDKKDDVKTDDKKDNATDKPADKKDDSSASDNSTSNNDTAT